MTQFFDACTVDGMKLIKVRNIENEIKEKFALSIFIRVTTC